MDIFNAENDEELQYKFEYFYRASHLEKLGIGLIKKVFLPDLEFLKEDAHIEKQSYEKTSVASQNQTEDNLARMNQKILEEFHSNIKKYAKEFNRDLSLFMFGLIEDG